MVRIAALRIAAALPLLLSLATPGAAAPATDAFWDGNAYLRVPVRLGSDTRLVMPEPFDDSWERDSEVACTLLDARTLIIRPRSAHIEQRLTLRGRNTGTLYLARVSSALPFAPIVTVHNAVAPHDDTPSGRSQPSVIGLLKAMMQGNAPAGYQVQRSARVLFDHPPYRVVAEEVWRSRRQTGVVAVLSAHLSGQGMGALPIVPANILIRVPELGNLRAMAADSFEIDFHHGSTRVYLVFAD